MNKLHVIDSHTAGEPTRIIVGGGPDLGTGSVAERLEVFRTQADHYRSAVVHEPRGSDVLVGGLMCEPSDPSCATGVMFFNNVGYLGMCGHGLIGLITTLGWLERIKPGVHRVETPVGVVSATLNKDGTVTIENVPSFRKAKDVTVSLGPHGTVTGDIAWGGNWFYLVSDHGKELKLTDVDRLTEYAWTIRQAINAAGFPEVDHVELFGPPVASGCQSRNFVLCPGKAYDRSPCGTGTSAKLACLAADGKLAENMPWFQESILGTRFLGTYKWEDREAGRIVPSITGAAYVTAYSQILLDENDPFCWGIAKT